MTRPKPAWRSARMAPVRKAWQDGIEFRLPTPAGPANPVSVYFCQVAQSGHRARAEQRRRPRPPKITLPCEYVGQFYPQRDADWVQFDAKKGEVYYIEVISHQLGLESDPYFALFRVTKNDKGEEQVNDVAQVDDGPGAPAADRQRFRRHHRRSVVQVRPCREDGTYRLMLRDQFGDGRKDPSYVYRLAIRPAEPDFRVLAFSDPAGDRSNEQNQTQAGRRNRSQGRHDGDRRRRFSAATNSTARSPLSVEGLPAGVTCPGAIVGGDVNAATLVVRRRRRRPPPGPDRSRSSARRRSATRKSSAKPAMPRSCGARQNRQQQTPEFRLSPIVAAGRDRQGHWSRPSCRSARTRFMKRRSAANVEIPITVTRRGDSKEAIKLTATGLPQRDQPEGSQPRRQHGRRQVRAAAQPAEHQARHLHLLYAGRDEAEVRPQSRRGARRRSRAEGARRR